MEGSSVDIEPSMHWWNMFSDCLIDVSHSFSDWYKSGMPRCKARVVLEAKVVLEACRRDSSATLGAAALSRRLPSTEGPGGNGHGQGCEERCLSPAAREPLLLLDWSAAEGTSMSSLRGGKHVPRRVLQFMSVRYVQGRVPRRGLHGLENSCRQCFGRT